MVMVIVGMNTGWVLCSRWSCIAMMGRLIVVRVMNHRTGIIIPWAHGVVVW